MDEFSLIRRIVRMSGNQADPRVVLGIGDDAAVLAPHGRVVATTDAFFDGVHFDLGMMKPMDAGYRAVAGSMSDLAAMGASPLALLVALEVPVQAPDPLPLDVMRGVTQAAKAFGAALVGGNVAATPGPLGLTVTALGEARGRVLTRSGARPGDGLFVTGTLGRASLGLAVLRDHPELVRRYRGLVMAFLRPGPRLDEGMALTAREEVHAAIDISDGLLADLAHMMEASKVGAVIHLDRIPLSREGMRLARRVGLDPLDAALAGGDDYELLVAAKPGFTNPGLSCIGRVTRRRGLVLTRNGKRIAPPERTGFIHRWRGDG